MAVEIQVGVHLIGDQLKFGLIRRRELASLLQGTLDDGLINRGALSEDSRDAGWLSTVDLEMKRKAIEKAQAIEHPTARRFALWRTDESILTWLETL